MLKNPAGATVHCPKTILDAVDYFASSRLPLRSLASWRDLEGLDFGAPGGVSHFPQRTPPKKFVVS
jgi:hypothetical protein